jgi:uncharacterized protein with LGFP repeats
VRELVVKLLNRIRQSNKARAAKRSPRRAFLRVEGLEARELMSASPLPGLGAVASHAAHVALHLDPIQAKYQSLQGVLGPAVSPEMPTPYGGGIYQEFVGGDIFYSPATGAHYVGGDSVGEWELTAGEHGANGVVVQKILGLPTTDEAATPGIQGAFVTHFQGGAIYFSNQLHSELDSFAVYGAIGAEYAATAFERGGNGEIVQQILGVPTSEEMNVPGVAGARMETFQGGTIYWSPSTGAHVVYGAIGAKYEAVGGPTTYGLPVSDEANVTFVSGARVSFFQGGRAIYWSQTTGAHLVYGAIEAKYLATANERDYYGQNVKTLLGAPTSDEMNVPGVPGARMNTFQGGTIYWSSATGAHVVYGGIGAKYESIGGPASFLGLPTSDELQYGPHGRISYFQHGRIVFDHTGVHVYSS